MPISSGELDRRIIIERDVPTRDGHGNDVHDWHLVAQCWAKFMPGAGRERREAARDEASLTATFRVRKSAATSGLNAETDRILFQAIIWDINSIALSGLDGIDITATTGYAFVVRVCEGAIVGSSTLAGMLTVAAPLAGGIAGSGAVAGALTVTAPLVGSIAGSGALAGAITVLAPLAGNVAGSGALSGNLTVAAPLAGGIAGAGALTATLTVDATLFIASVDAVGWSVQWASGTPPTFVPDVSPQTIAVSRPGFDATGAATTYTDNLTLTQRVRQPYPNQASLTASTVALSNYVYSTDTIPGVTNNSTMASPIPIANWALVDRAMVSNTLRAEVVAFHRNARNGKQVACVVFTVTDGTTTVTQTVANPSILGHPGDKNSVIGYAADIDITSLANGQITLNAKVYPWIGNAASVIDSSTGTANSRNFCPQVYTKNTTRFAAPYLAYLSATGNDGTGAVSTSAATAAASPFATLNNLIVAARAAMPGNRIDGLRVRFMDGFTGGLTSNITFNTYQDNTEVVFEPDPAGTGTGVFTFGVGNYSMQFLYLRLKGLNVTRNGIFAIVVLSAGKITLENCTVDNASNNAVWSAQGCYLLGTSITNGAANVLNAGGTENRLVRGVTYGTTGSQLLLEGWLVLGCSLTNVSCTPGARSYSGGIEAFNKNMKCSGGSNVTLIGVNADVSGYALVQNVIEWIGTGSTLTVRASADNDTGNFSHFVCHHNTITGFGDLGRWNIMYNETTGTLRTHNLASFVGNIISQLNTKHDVFSGVNKGLGDASSRVGGWAFMYGVGCRSQFSQFVDASGVGIGSSFAQAYPGLKGNLGTSSTVRNDPKFVNYQGTTSGPTAGTGNGDYRITAATSPCAGQVTSSVLPYTLDGVARATTNDNMGALSAA